MVRWETTEKRVIKNLRKSSELRIKIISLNFQVIFFTSSENFAIGGVLGEGRMIKSLDPEESKGEYMSTSRCLEENILRGQLLEGKGKWWGDLIVFVGWEQEVKKEILWVYQQNGELIWRCKVLDQLGVNEITGSQFAVSSVLKMWASGLEWRKQRHKSQMDCILSEVEGRAICKKQERNL